MKGEFFREFLPKVERVRDLEREKSAAMKHSEEAEANARAAIQAEMTHLREQVSKLREENFDLRGSI